MRMRHLMARHCNQRKGNGISKSTERKEQRNKNERRKRNSRSLGLGRAINPIRGGVETCHSRYDYYYSADPHCQPNLTSPCFNADELVSIPVLVPTRTCDTLPSPKGNSQNATTQGKTSWWPNKKSEVEHVALFQGRLGLLWRTRG